MTDSEADVPYGEDFHDPAVAAAWADGVMRKRPWRVTIFEHFVSIVRAAPVTQARVLELGSGPGFLAEQLLAKCPNIARYTLLDFSEPMLDQSRQRLSSFQDRTEFLRADFKADSWPSLVSAPVDFVVSLQAVPELRHKRHAQRLYTQVSRLLRPGAQVLICDHLPAGAHTPRHRVLYMDPEEKLEALTQAGLADAKVVWSDHDMAFYRARASAPGQRDQTGSMNPRLKLVDANLELMTAAVAGASALEALLGVSIADDWAGFPEALPILREAYANAPASQTWGSLFFIEPDERALVGFGGFKGPPSSDAVVEIGYAIAPAFQGRGLATDAVAQMLQRAFADPSIRAVDAHTLGHANPSTRVLEKSGFQKIGDAHDPDAGAVWHWRRERPAP